MATNDPAYSGKAPGKSPTPPPDPDSAGPKRSQKQPGQDLDRTGTGGPIKEQMNDNRPSERE